MSKIVLVGAGGTGMSGVASLLHDLGYTNLICIDAVQSELTDKLKEKGLKVIIGHDTYEPKLDDVIIYSEAAADSREVSKAREISQKNKKTMLIWNYFQFLGEISKYFVTVGFAGTNGKSSSTALAIHTAKKLMPDFGLGILGALVPEFNNQSYVINSDHKNEIRAIFDFILTGKSSSRTQNLEFKILKKFYFFVEACEYKRHFLYLDLDYTLITSLELDHTDYYKDMDDYLSAFQILISKTKHKVFMPENLSPAQIQSGAKIIKIPIKNIKFSHLLGDHNNVNGSLVLELMSMLTTYPKAKITDTMKTFGGLRRRLEYLGKNKNGAKIFTDYGHMASSIEFGYQALKKKFPEKKFFVIFQPHQINRIVTGWEDFIKVLNKYDQVLIYDIYAARENIKDFIAHHAFIHKENIHTLADLGNHFAQKSRGTYTTDFGVITQAIQQAGEDTMVVVYSAGDIDYKLRSLDFRG